MDNDSSAHPRAVCVGNDSSAHPRAVSVGKLLAALHRPGSSVRALPHPSTCLSQHPSVRRKLVTLHPQKPAGALRPGPDPLLYLSCQWYFYRDRNQLCQETPIKCNHEHYRVTIWKHKCHLQEENNKNCEISGMIETFHLLEFLLVKD